MILEFDNIQFAYDERPLLSGIYVKCETGKVTGLLGRNGAGKSTLLKIVFGSQKVEMASVRVDGSPLSLPAFTSKLLHYLPQDNFVPNDMKLSRILKLYDVDPMNWFGYFPELKNDLQLTTGEMSGGKCRLFEVLLVLSSPAPFCLLDEPFTGLTPIHVELLQLYMKEQAGNKGILITDHLYRKVVQQSNLLYVLVNGKTYSVKNVEELTMHGYLLDP